MLPGVLCCGVKLDGCGVKLGGHGCLRCRIDLCALCRENRDVSWIGLKPASTLDGTASGDVYRHFFDVPLVVRQGLRGRRTVARRRAPGVRRQ